MPVNNVSSIKAGYVAPSFKAKEAETEVQTQEIKDGKKKLYLALGALAVAGAALVGWAVAARNGKETEVPVDSVKAGAEKVKKGIEGLVRGEDLPFEKVETRIYDKSDPQKIIASKDALAKYNAVYNGQNVVVEEKLIDARKLGCSYGNYAFIRDAKTGKLITVKKLDLSGNEFKGIVDNSTTEVVGKKITNADGSKVVQTYKNGELYLKETTSILSDGTQQIVSENNGFKGQKVIKTIAPNGGSEVVKTYKDDVLFSTQTTTVLPDKTKQTTVDYKTGGKKIITIAPDGTETVEEVGKRKRLFGL